MIQKGVCKMKTFMPERTRGHKTSSLKTITSQTGILLRSYLKALKRTGSVL